MEYNWPKRAIKKLFLMAITAMFCASVIATETQTQTTTETNSEYAAGDSDWEFVKNVDLVGITQMGQTLVPLLRKINKKTRSYRRAVE